MSGQKQNNLQKKPALSEGSGIIPRTESTGAAETVERPRLVVIPGGQSETEVRGESSPASSIESASAVSPLAPSSALSSTAAISPGSSSGIRIDLDFFHGPMDLFLHLVQQQEVDISQVSMRVVAEQYLAAVSELVERLEVSPSAFERYDLEQVSEYLVIAATLIALKSNAVLPHASSAGLHEDVEPQSEQFLEELRERLRVYEHTKRRAEKLMNLPQLGVDTFSRLDRKALLPTPEMLAEPDDPRSLGQHLSRLLKRIGAIGEVFKIRLEPLSIVSSMMKIVDFLGSETKKYTFGGILRSFAEQGKKQGSPVKGADGARTLVIGSFLAVLELMKRGVLSAFQDADSSDISLALQTDSGGGAPVLDVDTLESEFDVEPALHEVNGG